MPRPVEIINQINIPLEFLKVSIEVIYIKDKQYIQNQIEKHGETNVFFHHAEHVSIVDPHTDTYRLVFFNKPNPGDISQMCFHILCSLLAFHGQAFIESEDPKVVSAYMTGLETMGAPLLGLLVQKTYEFVEKKVV